MKLLGLLVVFVLAISVVRADFIIDAFNTNGTGVVERLSVIPGQIYGTSQYAPYVQNVFNNVTNVTVKIFPNLYTAQNFPGLTGILGGTRRIVIATTTSTLTYSPTYGIIAYVARNQFSAAYGADIAAITYLNYFGNYQPDLSNCSFPYPNQCVQVTGVGNLLPNAYDITENGQDQALAFTVIYADQVGTQFTFLIYSNLTAISQRFIRTTAQKRDPTAEDYDEDFYSWEVKLDQPVVLPNGKRATAGRRYVLPFSSFTKLPTAATTADFTSVRGLQFQIANIIAIDNVVSDFRTVPLISGTKSATISETVVVDQVAEPNEIINYSIQIQVVTGLDVPVTNVFFYDNPTKFNSYATFLPNTVSLQSFTYSQINCSANDTSTCITLYTLDPTNFGASIFNASNDPAFANRIAVYFPAITTGSYVNINFSMSVPPLPCVLQSCSQGCTGPSNQASITGGCYCQINQGRVCYNVARNRTGAIATALDASNDTSAFVDGCSATTDTTNTTSYLTVTPIGTLPNPSLTIFANPTEKANGVYPCNQVQYTVNLYNNATRSSDAFVVNLTPDVNTNCLVGAGTPNPNLTSDATTGNPVYSVPNGLAYGQSLSFVITCNASCGVACGVNQTTMNAAINFGPNTVNCPESTTADDFGFDYIPLIGAPSISLSKANATAFTYGSANSSNIASFVISYANIGQRTASNVVITETIPSALAPYYVTNDNPSFAPAGNNNYTLIINSLTAGSSGSINFNLRLPSTLNDCVTGSFINTVSSSAVCGGTPLTAVAYVGVNAVPDMSVSIGNVSTSVQPGSTVCYNVQYQNIGYRVAQNVVLSINLPTYTTFSASGSAAWVQSGSSSVYTLSVGNITALSSAASAAFCVVAGSNTGCGTFFSTTVNVTSQCAGFPEQNLANNYATSVTTSITGTVSLSIAKTAVSSANAGSTVVYTITGSNSGTSQAQNVTIVENVPSGVTIGSNSGFVAGSSGSYSYFVGTVNAGSTFGPYNFSLVLPSSVACPAPNVSNTVVVTETCTGATASATAVVSINAAPILTMTASNVSTITLTQTTQTCVYACYGNSGTQTANSAVMTLNYGTSPYLTPVSGSNNGWTQSSTGVLSFNIGNINVGTNTCSPSACFTVATPIPCGVNNFNFTFSLTSPCAVGQNVTSSTTTNIIANPNFYISKTNNIASTASPGAAVTYTITYGNSGIRIADNTVLTESIPALFTPGTNNGWNCVAGASTCTYNVGSLSSSQGQQTVTFVGQLSTNIPGQSVVNNTVTISSPQPCASSASSSSVLNVAGYPNLIISKTDGGISITPGDMIMYTITYSNVGDTTAQNVYVYDTVPAFTVFNATMSAAGWSCVDGAGAGIVCGYFVGTVNPGQSGTISFVVKSDDWIRCGTNFTENFVYINTTTQESNYNDNNATDSTPIYGEPDLVIMKMTNRTMSRADRAGPGDLITYNITYSNIGVRDATNAVIYETVPAYTTFVAAASSPQWNCADGSAAGTVCTIAFNSTMYPVMPGMYSMGSMGELTFTVRVENNLPPEAHITTNCASINNTCGECNPFDNMACYTVNLFGVPDLVLNQSAICRSVHWYLEWQNVGDQGASNVVLTDTVPTGTSFNAAESDSRWSCSSAAAGAQCTLNVGTVASGAGGSAVFVTSPQVGTTLDMFSNTGCAQGSGRNPDPTPDNNCDTATVGFSGCPDACDSCCPVANECCPDKTEVLFNFRGILQGIDSCSAGSSSSS